MIRNVNACYTGHYALLLFNMYVPVPKSPFSGYSNGNAQTYKRLAGEEQPSQLNPTLQETMAKNQPWRCLCFGSALQITRMTPSRLTILQLRHNFLTEARTFIFTLRNFSGDQLSAVAFQVRLLQCRLILTGHHQSLHLSHKVHNHDNNDKQ